MIILRNKFFSRKNTRYKGRKPTPYNNVGMKPKTTVADILNKKSANTAAPAPVTTPKQLPMIANQKQLPAIVEKPKVNPLPLQSPTTVPKKVPTLMPNTVKRPGIGNSILKKVGKFAGKNKVALTVGGLAAYGLGVNHLMNNNE